MFKLDAFNQYLNVFNQRVEELYHRSGEIYSRDESVELLPIAFKELGTASEELVVALEQMLEQQQQLADSRHQLEAERRRYKNLFEEAPHAYMALDSKGVISLANRAATLLFNCTPGLLLHKPLSILVPVEARGAFREEFSRRKQVENDQEWQLKLYSPCREAFDATLTLTVEHDFWGNLVSTSVYIKDISARNKGLAEGKNTKEGLLCNRPMHTFSKGENIVLQQDAMWLVCKGWVKLSTITENNGEVLMGITGAGIPFCRSLTLLPIYQVTALSQTVELVSIPHAEIGHSSELTALIAQGITQRLQQTELFLSVSGRLRAYDRLVSLLQVLKTIFGEPVANGTRLSFRLTHQELADASCTTRVTITRLLSELQKQRKIKIDNTNHITLLD